MSVVLRWALVEEEKARAVPDGLYIRARFL
jgi:hypothetical protein